MYPPTDRHVYDATITAVIDGDTLVADIDLGFGIWRKGRKIRLLGCNCPEKKGETLAAGTAATIFTVEWLLGGNRELQPQYLPALTGSAVNCLKGGRTAIPRTAVIIRTYIDDTDNFGRVLARIWRVDPPDIDLATSLIASNQAVPFMTEGYR